MWQELKTFTGKNGKLMTQPAILTVLFPYAVASKQTRSDQSAPHIHLHLDNLHYGEEIVVHSAYRKIQLQNNKVYHKILLSHDISLQLTSLDKAEGEPRLLCCYRRSCKTLQLISSGRVCAVQKLLRVYYFELQTAS